MKIKIVPYFIVSVILAIFGTGCATQSFISGCNQRTIDFFNPSAVFQSTNNNNFALEGTYSNRPPAVYMATTNFHGYVIISQNELAAQHFATNDLTLSEIRKFSPGLTKHLQTKKKLPADFEKITNLPPNNIGLEVNEYYPSKWMYVFIPFPVAFDIATAPIQIPCYLLIGWAMANSHGC